METAFDARVTAAFGRHLLVRDASGAEHRARPFGRRLTVVCGDDVHCKVDARHGDVYVHEVRPRRTALHRANLRGESEAIVANLTQLLVVFAPRPEPDPFIVDRYIAAATSTGVKTTLVLNKADLGIGDALRAELEALANLGYHSIACSSKSGEGMQDLQAACVGEVSVLVGQSGVGKSSLVSKLVPGADVAIGELARDEEGRHTTTASRLFDVPSGGQLIDSPGVRDFAPAIESLESTSLGFVEVAQLAPGCRFQDCRHLREPGCAVQAAVARGEMNARRYESYRRLRRLYEELIEARGPAWRPPK